MTEEEVNKRLKEELHRLSGEVLAYHGSIQVLGRCLDALDNKQYCIVKHNKIYQIRFSHSFIEDMAILIKDAKLSYNYHKLYDSIDRDRKLCNTVIDLLASLQTEEDNRIKARIALEEEERDKYRRRY